MEIWKDIKGYEGLYQVSNYGRVKVLDRYSNGRNGLKLRKGKMLKPKICKTGYLSVGLFKDSKYKWMIVHRLVAQHFIDNIENLPQINHKDGDKSNNVVYNLEWVTSSENVIHSYNNGLTVNHGENNPIAKLTNEEVTKIKGLKGIYSQRQLAKMFGVSKSAIYFIHHNVNWKRHEENYA